MRRLALLAMLLVPLAARAEAVKIVDHARLLVGDVAEGAPVDVAKVDLGPSPAPGGSRVVSRAEVVRHVREAGLDLGRAKVPEAVRVVAASRRIGPTELATMVTPAIEKALPPGTTLERAKPSVDVVVPPRATVRGAALPKPPHQKGPWSTVAAVELESDGEVVLRVSVPVIVDVSEEAARPDVARGQRLSLVIEHHAIRISTSGTALADGSAGDVVTAQVTATGRVVRARIVSRDEAAVVEGP
jgi:hypothetical protein